MNPALKTFMSSVRDKTDSALFELLNQPTELPQQRLLDAMQYSVLNGGKRIRPALCFAAANAVGEQDSEPAVLAAASAIELVHAYSLIHDDLPAMDDDDLRRGQPTTHIAFDEATAVLAGDALQTCAFDTLINADFHSAEDKIACIKELSEATGAHGMCGGQMIDLEAVGKSLDLASLEQMHTLKTGALIRASVIMGAIASGNKETSRLTALRSYSEAIGLAFQVKDDILDATSDTETLGKRQGADAERNKPTYVSHLGLEGAKAKLDELHQEAIAVVGIFGESANYLRELANYIAQRTA